MEQYTQEIRDALKYSADQDNNLSAQKMKGFKVVIISNLGQRQNSA